jgi:hypothetical protein
MKSAGDRLVEQYLKGLQRELGDLPRARRRELVDEIASHIAEARAGLEATTKLRFARFWTGSATRTTSGPRRAHGSVWRGGRAASSRSSL